MGEIVEVFDDIKKSVGDKGFYILIGGVALLLVVNLLRNRDTTAESDTGTLTVATGYASYPDAVTNADVITDTIQNSIDYAQGEIMEQLETMQQETSDMNNELRDYMEEHFEATNNYINEGLESATETYKNTYHQNNEVVNMFSDVSTAFNNLSGSIQSLNSSVSALKSSGTSTATKKSNSVSYYTKTSYSGVSIVDGLKSIGVDSSYSNRAKIASKNGITNYKGTAQQNLALLSKLKSGKLIK